MITTSRSTIVARPALSEMRFQMQWGALLIAAVALHVLEAVLPNLGPWFKPGLANMVTLLAWGLFGIRAALGLTLARVAAGALLTGTWLTPTFFISLSAGLSSLAAMFLLRQILQHSSFTGLSLAGALVHMLVQVWIVESWLIQQPGVYLVLPPLLLLATLTGLINGILANHICARFQDDHTRS